MGSLLQWSEFCKMKIVTATKMVEPSPYATMLVALAITSLVWYFTYY